MKCRLVNTNFRENYIQNLLQTRGIEDIESYLTPNIKYLQSPAYLKNIDIAAALYLRIMMLPRPNILIIVDPDVDGFTSAAIIYQYSLQVNCHAKISYYLHEGKAHGLSDHIDRLMNENINYDLIICPDSSSNDAEYHDMLNEIHIPCLVLDHHITDVQLSDNAIVVNNQLSVDYINKELTGAGVVYQFCRFLDAKLNQNWSDKYIDLASWGIIADMGSMLSQENRYIVYTGLNHIVNSFYRTIIEKQAYSITGTMGATWNDVVSKLNPISIAFYVVPLVNALIRVGTMDEKELLFKAFVDGTQMVESNKRGAKGTLERADAEATRICTNARNHQNKMLDSAVDMAEAKIFKYDLLENKILLIKLEEEKFPAELNGLLAMKLSAKYKKPTLVLRRNSEGYDRGSARGLNQSELKDFKQFLTDSGMFEYAQGHANAFGASILDADVDRFLDYANEQLAAVDFGENCYDINFMRDADENDLTALISDVSQYSNIWGQGSAEPIINIRHILVNKSAIRIMGKSNDTVKITYNGISYMKFKATDFIEELNNLPEQFEMEVVGRANLNVWGGQVTPQIFIDDYECSKKPAYEF